MNPEPRPRRLMTPSRRLRPGLCLKNRLQLIDDLWRQLHELRGGDVDDAGAHLRHQAGDIRTGSIVDRGPRRLGARQGRMTRLFTRARWVWVTATTPSSWRGRSPSRAQRGRACSYDRPPRTRRCSSHASWDMLRAAVSSRALRLRGPSWPFASRVTPITAGSAVSPRASRAAPAKKRG